MINNTLYFEFFLNMQTPTREWLLKTFQTLNLEEKYEKILIYLHAMQKSEKNFIWLFSIFEELAVEDIGEDILNEIYSIIVDITFIWKDYEESWLDKMAELLQSLKENILDDTDANQLLDTINNL